MRRRKSQRGISLVEVLVAMTLLSALATGIVMTMRIGLDSMERAKSRLIGNRRVLGSQRAFESQLAGYIPVRGMCRPEGDGPGILSAFFDGEPQTMRFVSSYSLQDAGRGMPHILEYQVIPSDEGAVRLIVNELPYTGPLSIQAMCVGKAPDPWGIGPVFKFRQVQVGSQSFVLADKLASCHFQYREDNNQTLEEKWLDEWPHAKMPGAIRVFLEPAEPSAAKLQMTSFTFPIRINRDIMDKYHE